MPLVFCINNSINPNVSFLPAFVLFCDGDYMVGTGLFRDVPTIVRAAGLQLNQDQMTNLVNQVPCTNL